MRAASGTGGIYPVSKGQVLVVIAAMAVMNWLTFHEVNKAIGYNSEAIRLLAPSCQERLPERPV
jgi:hypothetical protein